MAQAATSNSQSWDYEADVVIVGAGAAGLPAAIKAAEGGATVIVVDANYDVGGHAIVSGGNVPLGGGTSAQKRDRMVTEFQDPETPPSLFYKKRVDGTRAARPVKIDKKDLVPGHDCVLWRCRCECGEIHATFSAPWPLSGDWE
jgi:heterodisulfide reductase subunit A-like polyferredoxin